jgi:protein import protein ZIM17
MEIQFTCNKCETRQAKRFTRLSYEKGVVIVKCDGCGVQHLIADHLNYFAHVEGNDVTEYAKQRGFAVENRLSQAGPGAAIEILDFVQEQQQQQRDGAA